MKSARAQTLMFRLVGHGAIALLAITMPQVGPNRYWLAGLLIGVGTPVATFLNQKFSEMSRNWIEAAWDMVLVVTLVHLVPHLWFPAMCLGLMVAMAPSVSLHPASHWIYMAFGAVLLVGMSIAAFAHDQSNWVLPILAVAVTYPSMLFYTYTQMRRARELRQRAQLMRGMTELAGCVAHDFNNLLTSISGHAELALDDMPKGSAPRAELEFVLQGTERAGLLCAQLLSFAGREVDRVERVELQEEIATMVGLLGPAMPAGVDIQFEAPPESVYIEADVSKVHQVLMNVLLNAGEAMMGQKGVIKARLFIETTDASQHATLTVSDSGSGIPEDLASKVFDPFFTTKEHGHGLGLSATQRVMQELKGQIDIESGANGTVAKLHWPMAQAEPVASDAPQAPASNPATPVRRLVLVVDDDMRVREVAKRLLTKLGYEVLEAADADSAVAIFRREHRRIGAVLLDLKMPVRNGWSCLEELRQIDEHTRVIVSSGFNPTENWPSFAQQDEHLGFLKKPYQTAQLQAALVE